MNGLTFLISTLDEGIFSIRDHSHVQADFLILHQLTDAAKEDEYRRYVAECLPSHYQYHVMQGKGLSRSRNAALSLCQSRFAYILDDDVMIHPGAERVILECFEASQAGCITFPHHLPADFASAPAEALQLHDLISAARVSSIDIALDLEQFWLRFDERFGLGSRFPSGEEYVLLADALKNGVPVLRAPVGVTRHEGVTSGADFFSTPEKASAKAQMFRRVTGRRLSLLALAFFLKKLPIVVRQGHVLTFSRYFFFPVSD